MATQRRTSLCLCRSESSEEAYYRKPSPIRIEDKREIEEARKRAMVAHAILKELQHSPMLTLQQKRTIWGQALSGDIDGAWRGLARLKRWME